MARKVTRCSPITATLVLAWCAHAQVFVGDLRVENLAAPLAIANGPGARFSWRTDVEQLSYRVLVQSAADSIVVWDTGTVTDNSTRVVPYDGRPLSTDTDYLWTVDATLFGIGPVSASAAFTTAPAVMGSWIGGFDTLRTSFILGPQPITRSRLHVSGVGCYHVYVNGARLSAELSPGFAYAPNVRVPYDSYDIQSIVQSGAENVVGIRLGSCKYGYLGSYCNGTAQQCNAAWALLTVTDATGNTTTVTTGPGWQGTQGPILFQHLYHGETYNARLEQSGWASPGFTPSAPWSPVVVMSKPDLGPLVPSAYTPVVRATNVTASSITGPRADGSFVFDFGRNMAGICTLSVSGPAGNTVSLVHAEQLNADGSVRNTFVPCAFAAISDCANQTVNYTLAGTGSLELYTPHFTYAGFRYVQLWGWPSPAPPSQSALVAHFTHSDLPQAGSVVFNGSTPTGAMLNALQASVVATHQSNLVSLPTDCPQREKRGWTGDAQLTAHSAILNLDMLAFYENWHQTMLDQQRVGCIGANRSADVYLPPNWECSPVPIANLTAQDYIGSIGDVVPQGYRGMGLWPGDASWEVAAILIPHELLEQYGDVLWLARNYDGPVAMLAWFNRMATADPSSTGLLPWSYLGDWIPIAATDGLYVANWHYLLGAYQAAEIASAVGNTTDATTFLALAALISDAMPARWWNSSLQAWDTGSQCAQLLGLYLQTGGQGYIAQAQAALVADIASRDTHLSVGAAGARYLLQVLTDMQRSDVSLALAVQDSYPSWGYFLSEAGYPGTMWESWSWNDTVYKESSGNHIFKAGGLGSWLYETAAGIHFAHRLGEGSLSSGPGPCPCEEELGLPYSVTDRLGLTCPQLQAVCDVVGSRREVIRNSAFVSHPKAVWGLQQLRLDIQIRLAAVPQPAASSPALTPRVGLVIDAAVADAVGQASGWRATPAGNVSFHWQLLPAASAGGPRSVRVQAQVPCGALSRLEMPLGLLHGADGPQDATVRVMAVNNEGAASPMSHAVSPVGSVAAWVDGRRASRLAGLAAAERAAVVQLACGQHELELQIEEQA